MAQTLFELVGKITIDTETAAQNITAVITQIKDDLPNAVTNAGNNINNNSSFTAGTVWLGEQLVQLTNKVWDVTKAFYSMGIGFNSDIESYEKQLAVLLQDTEKGKQLVADLQELAKETPLGLPGLAKNAVQLISSYDPEFEEIIPTLEMLGNLALGDQEKLDGLTKAFIQVMGTGSLLGDEMNQLVEHGIPFKEMITDLLGSDQWYIDWSHDPATFKVPAEYLKEAFEKATAEGGKYHNYMYKMMDTYEGMVDRAGETSKELAGELVKPWYEVLKDDIMPQTSELMEELQTFITENNGTITLIADIVGGIAAGGLTLLTDALEWLADNKDAVSVALAALAAGLYTVSLYIHPIGTAAGTLMALLAYGRNVAEEKKANAMSFSDWHAQNSDYGITDEELLTLQQYVELMREMETLYNEMAEGNQSQSVLDMKMQLITEKMTELESLLVNETPENYKDLITDYNRWMAYRVGLGAVEDNQLLDVYAGVKLDEDTQQLIQAELDKMGLTVPVTLKGTTAWNLGTTQTDEARNINSLLEGINLEDYYNTLQEARVNVGGSTRLVTDNSDVVNALARVESVLYQIEHKTGTTQNVVLNTGALVGALAPSMDAHLGVLGSRKARSG